MAPEATPPSVDGASGVHVTLDELVRLQAQARGFAFLPRQPMHSILAGKHGSKLRGRGLNFEEIRAYLPGDDIRTLDWKVTARLREPHIRVYNEERDRPGLFVVDLRSTMFFGSEREMKSVTAARAAALGAWRVLSQDDRVGAIVFGDDEIREIRPHRSRRTVMGILRTLVDFDGRLPGELDATRISLNAALERACRTVLHDGLVAVISDFVDADEDTRRLMTKLAAHNDVMVIHVHDRLERELPAAGRLVISGQEGQLELDTDDPKLRERFAADFARRSERAKRFLMKRAVPVLPLDTSGDVAAQIRARLGMARSRRGSKGGRG